MWILSILPDSMLHLIFAAGVCGTIAGFVLGFIPFINKYKLPIQIISLIVLSLGVYLEGGLANEEEWKLKVKAVEAKVAVAEAKSATENVKIVEKIVKKTEIVRTRGADIIKYVDREVAKDREVIKFVENCPIPQVIIKTHNAAALNQPIEDKK